MKHSLLLGGLAILTAFLPSIAWAQAPPTVPAKHTDETPPQGNVEEATAECEEGNCGPTPSLEGWYGYQILIADAAAMGMLGLAMEKNSVTWLYGASGTYLLPSPIIHAAHHNPGRAFGSFGIRLAAAAAGIKIMYGDNSSCGKDTREYDQESNCTAAPLFVTAILGGLLDAGLLAWETPSKPSVQQPPKATSRSESAFLPQLSPTVASLPGGAYLGLLGSF